MHPYTKVIQHPVFTELLNAATKHNPQIGSFWEIVRVSPDPGLALCVIFKAFNLSSDLVNAMEKCIQTPDISLNSFFEDPKTNLASNKDAIDHRYSILDAGTCIKENFNLGFNAGILFGYLQHTQPLTMESSWILQRALQASEQLAMMGYVQEDTSVHILGLASYIRNNAEQLSKEYQNRVNNGEASKTDLGIQEFIKRLEKEMGEGL